MTATTELFQVIQEVSKEYPLGTLLRCDCPYSQFTMGVCDLNGTFGNRNHYDAKKGEAALLIK